LKHRKLHKFFAGTLLVVYSAVIFQEGVVEGIHLVSHASEIFSNNFAFHQHGNGKYHFHHHGFMDTVRSLLHHDGQQEQSESELPVPQYQIKLHLPVTVSSGLHHDFGIDFHYFIHNEYVPGRTPEVLKPPPQELMPVFLCLRH
jgi:hypothetical protein